ncbi:MAG TPA: deoxyribonuclease IV [Longimicrobiales bacterium]|nr:deoxyribonuclease IV [Longimicrobiales bacterium]
MRTGFREPSKHRNALTEEPQVQTRKDEIGAHISVAGGTPNAPGRAAEVDASVMQIFTKQASRWAERDVEAEEATAFREAREHAGITHVASHDSYLINLATPDPALLERSLESFTRELGRCEALGLEFLVTHPGNATDGDPDRGVRQNAESIIQAISQVPGRTRVLLEGTAGSGTALGSTFEELATIHGMVAERYPDRVGVCLDTCHLWAAGYDLRDLDAVLAEFDAGVGLRHLHFLHLNDSATPFRSHRDRHAGIGEGSIGEGPFAAVIRHPRLRDVPKVIETPKGDDPVASDRANLARLRSYRE